jgi:hypothetical protein
MLYALEIIRFEHLEQLKCIKWMYVYDSWKTIDSYSTNIINNSSSKQRIDTAKTPAARSNSRLCMCEC